METIKSGNLQITTTELGAELLSVKYNDKERLWQNENGSWSGHAPVLFPVCGAGAALGVSPLLACMAMGTVYVNLSGDEKLFRQLNYFSPPILLMFFVRSGMSFRLDTLFDASSRVAGVPLILIGCLYFVVRITGKYAGAYIGCRLCGKPQKTTRTLGLALIPQAGVAIGLSELAARTIGGVTGTVIQTVIMSSSILYELIGPAMAKLALTLLYTAALIAFAAFMLCLTGFMKPEYALKRRSDHFEIHLVEELD